MSVVHFISHPEVEVDPAKSVPQWRLSAKGKIRMQSFAETVAVPFVAVWSSDEMKAVEAAAILARQLGLSARIEHNLHENDRSATGFLPPQEFELTADAFFAEPGVSVRGWERAIDAQERISAAVDRVLSISSDGDVAIVAHGGVGTLLLCKYLGIPISRAEDQPHQGHHWAFDRLTREVFYRWKSIA